MRIAYFDLGFSQEDYSIEPTKYGGGAVVARYLKQDPSIEMVIFAPAEAFNSCILNADLGSKVGLNSDHCNGLRRGLPISDALDAIGGYFDLVLHGHTCFSPNRGTYRGPICHWSGFQGDAGHPGNDYILLYNDSFKPQFGERPKYVRIGKPVPPVFAPSIKDQFIFQCSRHDDHMNTIAVAKQCLQYGIKGVFAGPIHNGYPLMEYIDNATTHYLGEISESAKLEYSRKARLMTLVHNWDKLPFNQSVIEAQGQGTPIYVNPTGPFLSIYLKRGVNGFASTDMTLKDAYDLAPTLDQRACWEAAREFDVSVMVSSFKKAFREIVAEWPKS